ncbi:MAG: IS110 family transposase [Leptospirales bacterium]
MRWNIPTANCLPIEAIGIADILLTLKDQLSLNEKKMTEIALAHPLGEIFYSLPGAGKILATKLLGLLGDNKKRFSKANQAQSLFGTAPINYQSGGYHKVMMRKTCNKRGKSILFTFDFSSLQYAKWAKETMINN